MSAALDVLLLRLDAPLMSFGGVVIDQHNRTDPFPYRAMLVGLLANALGLERRQEAAHQRLQERLRYAARCDRRGELLVDYQTVDFDPAGSMASDLGWTTRGELEERKGGDAADGTHIRYRHYLADAVFTVAVALAPAEEAPDAGALEAALRAPARPLFLGRKCCVPSAPVLHGRVHTPTLREALAGAPRVARRGEAGRLSAIWPESEGTGEANRRFPRVEDRDWSSAIHVGRRIYVEGLVDPPSAEGEV